jgi:pSer/pThr/pTyr-binding forkhead associated (FHA) protein
VHPDLDDTRTTPPPAVRQRVEQPNTEQPDTERTVVAGDLRSSARDPHMWPDEQPAAPWPPALSPPTAQFYGFRIGNSQIVLLDAIAYVGRRPATPRVVRGGTPRLVRVQSPTQEVSATHLELRQEGGTVVARDLRSTNGTVLAVPGHPVRALRPGESVVVTVGSLIDIGDRNVIEILPLQVAS